MKARTWGVRVPVAAVLAVEVVALGALMVWPPGRAGWWPAAGVTAAATVLLVVTVHRRSAAGWVWAWARWRRRVRAGKDLTAAAVDVPHGHIVCGVRTEPTEAITMIRVTGRAYAPTFLRGGAVSLTANVLPLGLIAGLLDQPGALKLSGIDIVSSGHRVRPGTGYPPLYSTLLADRPAAGQRATQLIVRTDIVNSVPALRYRTSVGAAAAAATERIINALRQEGFRAGALNAAELDEALERLGGRLADAPETPTLEPAAHDTEPDGVDGAAGESWAPARPGGARTLTRPDPRVGWRAVAANPGYLTSYYFSPEDINTVALQQMWALRCDEIVQTTSIWKDRFTEPDGGGPVLVSAVVRTADPQRPSQPPTLFLNPMPGDQYAAALHAAPGARPALTIPARPLGDPSALAIPIGSTGILIGAALSDDAQFSPPVQRDDLVMLALTDPARATRIDMDTGDFYVRQLLIRAAAAGERIAIYSSEPARWMPLSQVNIAVVERRQPLEFVPSVIVNDRPTTPPSAGLSATVITLGETDRGGPAADLRFVQVSRDTVRVTTSEMSLDVAIVAFRQEQAWTGG